MAETTQPAAPQSRERETEQAEGGVSSASMKLVGALAWLGLGGWVGRGNRLEGCAKPACCGVAVVVCPAGYGGHGDAFTKDTGHICFGGGGEVVLCDCGDGGVTEGAPGIG